MGHKSSRPSPISFIVAADTHMQRLAWMSRPRLYGDAFYSFQQILHYMEDLQRPLILAGDVADASAIDGDTITAFMRASRLDLPDDIRIWHIDGQHDRQKHGGAPLLNSLPRFHRPCEGGIYGLTGDQFGQLTVRFNSWLAPIDLKRTIASYNASLQTDPAEMTDVWITHQRWYGGNGSEWHQKLGYIGNADGDLGEVDFCKLLISGDLHKTARVRQPRRSGGSYDALSPGSTCMQDCAESPHKFFFTVHDDLTTTAIPLDTRPVVTWPELTDSDDLERCLEEAPDMLRNVYSGGPANRPDHIRLPIFIVKHSVGIHRAGTLLLEKLSPHAEVFESLTSFVREEEQGREVLPSTEDPSDLRQALREVVEDLESAEYQLCDCLLANPADPDGALASWRAARLATAQE